MKLWYLYVLRYLWIPFCSFYNDCDCVGVYVGISLHFQVPRDHFLKFYDYIPMHVCMWVKTIRVMWLTEGGPRRVQTSPSSITKTVQSSKVESRSVTVKISVLDVFVLTGRTSKYLFRWEHEKFPVKTVFCSRRFTLFSKTVKRIRFYRTSLESLAVLQKNLWKRNVYIIESCLKWKKSRFDEMNSIHLSLLRRKLV